MKNKILFLVSGNGGTMQFIHHAIQQMNLNLAIVGVVADRDCGALTFAIENKIQYQKIVYNKNNRADLAKAIAQFQPNIIITTFHKIIDNATLQQFEHIKFLNVHYSLLPNFAGIIGFDTLIKAKELNLKKVGTTIHFVTEKVDAGEIIAQSAIEIESWNDVIELELKDALFKSSCVILIDSLINFSDAERKNNHQAIFNQNKFSILLKPISNNIMNNLENYLKCF